MEKFIRNFLAIGLGSFIGSKIALWVNGYYWWVGLIAGGIFGYLSCDFREVVAAVQTAYKKVIGAQFTELQKAAYYAFFMAALNLGIFALIGAVAFFWVFPGEQDLANSRTFFLPVAYGLITIFAGFFKSLIITIDIRDASQPPLDKSGLDMVTCKYAAMYISPVKAFTYWPWMAVLYFGKGLWWLWLQMPAAFWRTCAFVKMIFTLIHTEKRLVRLFYCALGTLIGYCFGSAIIGFLGGGLVGATCADLIPRLVKKPAEANP